MREIDEFLKCRKDVAHFATNYCFTEKKIRENGAIRTVVERFPDYPYLRVLLHSLNQRGNTLDEKSRQMLWSWSAMIDTLHSLTFQNNYSEKVISRKEVLVDDGGQNATTDSLFGRLCFIHDKLPVYLKAPLEFTNLRIVNPITNSFVKGESSNVKAGRGGSYNKIKADEWAFCDNSESIFSALHSACPDNKKFGSTPNGKGNNFARLRFTPPEQTGFKVNTWHWHLNPEKTPTWYDNEIKGLTKEQIAREYEISYEGSVEGRVYHSFDFTKQVRPCPYNPNLPLYTAWDFGIGDPTAIIFIQLNPNGEIYIVDEYENNEEEAPHYAGIVRGKFSNYTEHIGDPAGTARGVTKKSWISWLQEMGIFIKTPYTSNVEDRILATRRIIPRIFVDPKCVLFLDRIANYKFPTDDEGRVTNEKPIHNWAGHMMTALEFFAIYKFPLRSGGIYAIK